MIVSSAVGFRIEGGGGPITEETTLSTGEIIDEPFDLSDNDCLYYKTHFL